MAGTTAETDLVRLLVLDCPPPGLSPLLRVRGQVDAECRRGREAPEGWLRPSRVRP